MKRQLYTWLIALMTTTLACSESHSQTNNMPAAVFSEKIKQTPDGLVLDVRTPEEFSKGHLKDARNVNWKDSNFAAEVAKIDKSKPVFVYCLVGGRSAAAAAKMREMGFNNVYELEGGIIKWRAANLPETTEAGSKPVSLTRQQFNELLNSDKLVLVDFYADWCEPCKKMEPYLNEIASEMKDKVQVLRINADDNAELCKALKVDALPVLQLYKNSKIQWTHEGFIAKTDVIKQLK
jgi:thioredoxin 1